MISQRRSRAWGMACEDLVLAEVFSVAGTLLSTSFDAGGTLEEAQDLLGHISVISTQVYAHPDPARLRAAVDAVPSPLARAGGPA